MMRNILFAVALLATFVIGVAKPATISQDIHKPGFYRLEMARPSQPPPDFLAFGAQSLTAPAPGSTWSAAYWLGYHRSPSAIVQYKLATIPDILGKPKWSLDVESFAGAQLSDSSPLAGFDVGKSWRLALTVQGFLGAGFSVAAGKPSGFGFAAGLSVQF